MSLHIFLYGLDPGKCAVGPVKKPIISKHSFLFWNGEFIWVSVAFSNMYGKHHFLWLTEANVF